MDGAEVNKKQSVCQQLPPQSSDLHLTGHYCRVRCPQQCVIVGCKATELYVAQLQFYNILYLLAEFIQIVLLVYIEDDLAN